MKTFIILAAALALSVPARADSNAAAGKALDLSRMLFTPESYKNMLDKMVAAMAANAPNDGGKLGPTFWKRMRAEMDRLIPYQDMMDEEISMLVKYYTAEEIDQLAAFYMSPVGRKAIKVMPEMMADVMGSMQTRLSERLPAAIKRVASEEQKQQGDSKPVAPQK
jgi:hypothetical protein